MEFAVTLIFRVGFYVIYSFLTLKPLGLILCPERQSMQNALLPRRSERSHNHRFSFYVEIFSLPFLLTFAVGVSLSLSVIIPFLLYSVRVVFTARLCLKLLPSLLTATFLLSKKLTQLSLTLRCLLPLPSPSPTFDSRWCVCFTWLGWGKFAVPFKVTPLSGEMSSQTTKGCPFLEEKGDRLRWKGLLTLTFSFCRRLGAAP